MNLNILRAKLKLKREILTMFGYKPQNFLTINRAEKKQLDFVEKIEPYSEICTQTIYDPRSDRELGHTFNSRDVFKLHNITLEPKQGIIYSSDGKLLAESTNWTTSNLYESFPWNPGRISSKLDIEEALNLTSNAYGHWLVEDLGSILYLIKKFPNSPIIVYKNASRFVFELLEYLNREVILVDGPVRIKSIIMVTKQQDSGWMHPKDLGILKTFADNIKINMQNQVEKIYATRRNLKRSPKNENKIESLFSKFGFRVIHLEELNFIEEISLIKGVNLLAGVSGSWHFNSIWMKINSRILDIVNENYWGELPHRVCSMCQIKYSFYMYSGKFNTEVDLLKLEAFLEKELHLTDLI